MSIQDKSMQTAKAKLSRHVKVLENVGSVASTRDGKWIYHSLVSTDRRQKAVLEAIRFFPNYTGEHERDFARFKRRALLREGGRCRQPLAGRSVKKDFMGTAL